MALPPKGHVKRVFKIATNPDTGEQGLVTDYFVDVRRCDEMPIHWQSSLEGFLAQEIRYKFVWNDNPNNHLSNVDASNADIQFENANAKRKTKKRRIKDPDVPSDETSDTSMEDNDVLLWIIERLKMQLPRGDIFEGQVVQFVFNDNLLDGSEGTPSQTRLTAFMKVKNNDLNGMKMADKDGKNPVMVDWATYKEALQNGKHDDDDYLYLIIEFTEEFMIKFGADNRIGRSGLEGQRIKFVLNEIKKDVEFLFEQIAQSDADLSKVVRLDPLQTIVNVGSNVIAVEYAPEEQ